MSRSLAARIAALAALGALAVAACGEDQGVTAGPIPEATTTTPPTTPPTTAATDPTPTTATPATVTPTTVSPTLPCTPEALRDAYAARYGTPSGEIAFVVVDCLDGYAAASLQRAFDAPIYVIYRDEGGRWNALNRGVAGVCAGLGIPDHVGARLGCSS